jgi:hypothetical protein
MPDVTHQNLQHLQHECKSLYDRYSKVSVRTCDQVLALSIPISMQNRVDFAKWQERENIAYQRYTAARIDLVEYLNRGI